MRKLIVWLLVLAMAAGTVPALGEAVSDEAPGGETAEVQEETEPGKEVPEEPDTEEDIPEETGSDAQELITEEENPDEEPPEEETPEAAGSRASSVEPPKTFRLLQNGSRGEDVVKLQQRLTELGYYNGAADGIFGKATRTAVRAFQKRNGLSVDGVAGKKTQTALYSAEAVGDLPPAEPTDTLAGEWPMLVNREYPVGEDFLPADLVTMTEVCDSSLIKIKYASTRAVRPAAEALMTMLEAARADGVTKWQCSAAYRSYADQERILNNKINGYQERNSGWSRSRARRAALKSVAEAGASEHHLGLSFDLNVPGTSSFAGTKQAAWLHEHCWEYGFIVRYQEGKEDITGFTPEAWHIRYVGTAHSLIMRDENLCLEEYLQKYYPQAMEKTEKPAETGTADGEASGEEEDTPDQENPEDEDGEFDPGFFEPKEGDTELGLIEELIDGEFDEDAEG